MHLPLEADPPRVARADLAAPVLAAIRVELTETRMPANAERREAGRRDLLRWVASYFPYLRPMNRFQRAFAVELQGLILGGAPIKQLKGLAAPRGAGKSTICQLAILWACMYHHVKFALILAANGDKAKERIASIQDYVLRNDLLDADFPEITGPIRDIGGDPRRAPPGFPWSTLETRLANGVWIVAAGIDGAIAGALRNDARPDLLLLDDVEAGSNVDSDAEAKQVRTRLQEALALPPQRGTSTSIFIGTLKSRNCLTAELTDAELNPAWRGERYRALEKLPVREDLWEAFMGILRPGERLGRYEQIADAIRPETVPAAQVAAALEFPLEAFNALREQHRLAYAFYVANQKAMDQGAEALDPEALPVRRIYEERATLGENYYRCELQNDPPPPADRLQALQLSALRGRAIAGLPPRTVPTWADVVILTVDVGLRALHWEASAWNWSRECSIVIDAGITSTGLGTDGRWDLAPVNSRAGLMERAIAESLTRLDENLFNAYTQIGSGKTFVPYGGVDVGGGTGQREEGDAAWAGVVIDWCGARRGRWLGLKGSGNWSSGLRTQANERNYSLHQRGFAILHSDWYKTQLYNSMQAPLYENQSTEPPGPAPLAIGARAFNSEIADAYLRQMTQEERDEKGRWVLAYRGAKNHWWDCAYMSFAVADLLRACRGTPSPPPTSQKSVVSPNGTAMRGAPRATRRRYG